MMVLSVALAAGLAAGQPAPPAQAATLPDWSRGKNNGATFATEFYTGFADCVVYRWPALGGAFVASLPGSDEETKALDALTGEAGFCLAGGQVKLERHRLRGAIAEQLLKRKAPLPRPRWLSGGESSVALRAKLLAAYPGQQPGPLSRHHLALRTAAYCTMGESRPLVEALLTTEPNSRTEGRALTELNPTLSSCLRGGRFGGMIAPSIRAYLAESLFWRRALEGTDQ
jgi:hypothetical protein